MKCLPFGIDAGIGNGFSLPLLSRGKGQEEALNQAKSSEVPNM